MAKSLKIVALGDSLTAGYMLPERAAFPSVLETYLRRSGHDVEVVNAGVSGDTASDALDRLEWAVGEDTNTDIAIVELGANDMLRGLDPDITYGALKEIVNRLQAKGVTVLLAGMLAAPGVGRDFETKFNGIFPRIAEGAGLPLYPFFLAGVAGDARLILPDGMHPNAAGVEIIVKGILPMVEKVIATVKPRN